ncbi:hypothetical protein [Siccibacter turicensis]|uniref:hypothetical protein n=1 Tax=Siccibacter turicensis TaxID=357233 RepID=UPI0010206927|nr:hypothetical protein [Siccibacter turicensis]
MTYDKITKIVESFIKCRQVDDSDGIKPIEISTVLKFWYKLVMTEMKDVDRIEDDFKRLHDIYWSKRM